MKPMTMFAVFAAALSLTVFNANAAPVTYSFTATGDHGGEFTFDDAATPIGDPNFSFGTVYAATSFTMDGTSFANPELVIYTNCTGRGLSQCAMFTHSGLGFGNRDFVQLVNSGTGLFHDASASAMDGLSLADFDGINEGVPGENVLSYGAGYPTYALTSLEVVPMAPVPEPGSYMLILSGVALVNFLSRKNRPCPGEQSTKGQHQGFERRSRSGVTQRR